MICRTPARKLAVVGMCLSGSSALSKSRSGFQSRKPLGRCVGHGNPTYKAMVTRTYRKVTIQLGL